MKYDLEQLRKENYYMRDRGSNELEITFQMTSECNFRCTYCYETKYKGTINLEDVYRVLDMLFPIEDHLDYWNGYFRDVIDKDTIYFNFFGGECLLEAEKMEKICDYFFKKCNENLEKYQKWVDNFYIICQTNGSLIQTKEVTHFINKYLKYFKFIFITIDGCKKMHDTCRLFKNTNAPTWDLVANNIKWFRKTYPDVNIVTKGTITPQNIYYLYESFLTYLDLGFNTAKITIQADCDWDDKYVKIADEQYGKIVDYMLTNPTLLKDNCLFDMFTSRVNFQNGDRRCYAVGTCHANGQGFCLDVHGNLYVCYSFTELSIPKELNRKPYLLGSAKDGISDEGMKRVDEMLHIVDRYAFESNECKSCNIQYMCEFCPGVAYKETGDIEMLYRRECKIRKVEQKWALIYKYYREKLYGDNYDENGRLMYE